MLKCYSVIIFNIFSLIILTFCSTELPKEIKKCQYGDTECIKNAINFILDNKQNGYPELGIPSLNPLKVKYIEIKQSKDNSLYLDVEYKDNVLNLADNLRVYKVSGFGKDLKGPHEINMKGTSVSLIGPYDSKGKIFGTELTGKGNQNLTIVDVDLKFIINGEPIEKNDKIYMKIKKFKLSFDTKRMYTDFDNLIGTDKQLNQAINTFLNENWKTVFDQLKEYYFDAFGKIFEAILSNIFDKYPYDELFEHIK